MLILKNDQIMPQEDAVVSPDDRGYYFGDGVYEVFKIYKGKLFEKELHYKRLERSAREIRLELPYSLQILDGFLAKLVGLEGVTEGSLYMQITRGIAPRNHAFPLHAAPELLAHCKQALRNVDTMQSGISAITLPDIRWLRCDIKSLNLLPNVLFKQQAVELGCGEAILHRDGIVTECSASNLMIVNNGTIRTHPANNLILHGITREVVLRLAQKLEIPVHHEPFSIDVLLNADEVFITGTNVEITPVVNIDNRPVNGGTIGPVTRKLQAVFAELI